MPSLKEIKGRIGSVKSTLKITSAMKLVASAKLRKAQQTIEGMRPYERKLQEILARLMEQGGHIPDGPEVARMLELSLSRLRKSGYIPYYLYRQKYMSGSLENVGWAKPGKESLYNIVMMEELQTVLSIGAGGVTKLVDPDAGKILRLPNPKFAHDYLSSREKVLAQKDEITRFYHP